MKQLYLSVIEKQKQDLRRRSDPSAAGAACLYKKVRPGHRGGRDLFIRGSARG